MELKKYRGVEIHVQDDGVFRARIPPDWLQADTLKALEAQIDRAVAKNKVRVCVPFTVLDRVKVTPKYSAAHWASGTGVKHMEAVSRRLDGGLMVREPGGKLERMDRYDREVTRRLTDDEVDRYAALKTALQTANKAWDEFERSVRLDLEAAVDAAIKAKVDDPGEAEEAAELVEDLDPR